jgi:hypothetical protein
MAARTAKMKKEKIQYTNNDLSEYKFSFFSGCGAFKEELCSSSIVMMVISHKKKYVIIIMGNGSEKHQERQKKN